ncbi:MAG: hypothetical protein AB2L09_02675 [Coriobacteriia bacterium]
MSGGKASGKQGTEARRQGAGFLRRFMDRLSSDPEPSPEIIPKRWRMPFFTGLIVVSLILLLLIIWLVVVPGIRSMQSASVLSLHSAHVQSQSPLTERTPS